jgi:plastocyanin
MWYLMFTLLGVCFTLVQQEFIQASYAQLILSIATNVEAGGGNKYAPLNNFKPEKVEIQVNETVKWHNPTIGIAYPHTVTFVGGGNFSILPGIPTNISQSSSYNASSLLGVMQKNLINKTQSIQNGTENHNITLNTSALIYPSIINSTTNEVSYLNTTPGHNGAKYTMNGTVTYLNSGLIFPEDNIPRTLTAISTFSVKFLTTGVYRYQCLIHPEMVGTINVIPKSNAHHSMS